VIRTASTLLASLALAVAAPTASGQAGPQLPEEVKQIRQLYLTYDDAAALSACNDYLVTHPGDPVVLELRAWSLRQLGRFDDAARTVDLINPKSTRLKLLLAECLGMNKANVARAHSIIDEVSSEDPNAVEPHLVRGRIYLAHGQAKEAAAEISYVRTTRPKLYPGQLLAAFLAEMSGNFDEALKLYLPLVAKSSEFDRIDPHDDRDAVVALAGCYLKMQRYEDAVKLYQQLAERFPKAPIVRAELALALSMQERTAEAIEACEKAVELAPSMAGFRTRLAMLYRTAGRNADAIAQLEKVVEAEAPSAEQFLADLRLAELYLEAGALDKAVTHAEAVMKIGPEHEDVLAVNARVREKVGDGKAAAELYRKAIDRNPLTFDAMYRLGLLLARSEVAAEQEEGKKLLDRHKKIEPYLLDIQRTQREYEINPSSPMLLTRLCGLLNLAGEYDQARRWGERSASMNSRSPSTYMQLGYVAANRGDNAAALKYFEMAQKMIPKGAVPELDGWIEKLKKGEPLELPMGKYNRPAQKPEQKPPPEPAKESGK